MNIVLFQPPLAPRAPPRPTEPAITTELHTALTDIADAGSAGRQTMPDVKGFYILCATII